MSPCKVDLLLAGLFLRLDAAETLMQMSHVRNVRHVCVCVCVCRTLDGFAPYL